MTNITAPSNQAPQLLELAKQKLLAPNVPMVMRITAFLRLSCLALGEAGCYSQLMQTLFNHNPEWWKTCEVTSDGLLISSDLEVQKLLSVVLQLHSQSGATLFNPLDKASVSAQSPVQIWAN